MNRPDALTVFAVGLALLAFAGCSSAAEDTGTASVADGDAVASMLIPVTPDALKAQFNADVGETRLFLLLSPT